MTWSDGAGTGPDTCTVQKSHRGSAPGVAAASDCQQHYVAGLSPEMTADEIDTLFCNLTDITKFQVDFCAVLKVR